MLFYCVTFFAEVNVSNKKYITCMGVDDVNIYFTCPAIKEDVKFCK